MAGALKAWEAHGRLQAAMGRKGLGDGGGFGSSDGATWTDLMRDEITDARAFTERGDAHQDVAQNVGPGG